MTQKTNGMQADNCNNIESKNGMSQVINILTGETKKIRCHYISSRTDKPVSRVLTLERLNHPALTAAGVTAWAERFNDGVNSFDWLRVSIQLTDKTCYTPNCANVELPDVENYGNLDYYMGQEGAMRVSMNNVDKFFKSIADKPAKMMTGEDWPNMAVIAAYRAAGRDEEADTLTTARDIYNARREAKNEAWSKKYAAQQYYYNSPKPKNFDELTELERAQFMMQTAQECAKDHPELDWADILERAEKRLEKAKEWQEFLDREAEKQNSFAEGMRVKVPAASLERNRDKEAFVITRIRRKAADNGGNASLTVKSELTGMEKDINGSDVSEILPALQAAPEIKPEEQAFNDALTISEGDKVLSKHYGTIGTVTRIYQEKGKTLYDVEFEQPVKSFWSNEMSSTGNFCRFGITKNFDAEGREIVGSAVYYAEELQADYWLGKARTIFDLEILPPTENRPQWLVNYDLLNTPKLATLYEIASYLSALYQQHRAA